MSGAEQESFSEMPEIRVRYERVVQVRPYETIRVDLSVTETILLAEENAQGAVSAKSAAAVARVAGELHRAFFQPLATMGDTLIAEQLAALRSGPKPRQQEPGEPDPFLPSGPGR